LTVALLDRLRAFFTGRGSPDAEAVREEVLEERIFNTPGEQEQRAVTDEGDRARHLDEGDLPPGLLLPPKPG
jgi:hypothetical protein